MSVDAHGMLGTALAGLFHPSLAEVRTSSQRRWSSVTFNGARHRFALSVSGEDAQVAVAEAKAALGHREFALNGHIVADITMTQRRSSEPAKVEVQFEALTVEAN